MYSWDPVVQRWEVWGKIQLELGSICSSLAMSPGTTSWNSDKVKRMSSLMAEFTSYQSHLKSLFEIVVLWAEEVPKSRFPEEGGYSVLKLGHLRVSAPLLLNCLNSLSVGMSVCVLFQWGKVFKNRSNWGSNPGSTTYKLWVLRPVSWPSQVSVSSSVKWETRQY